MDPNLARLSNMPVVLDTAPTLWYMQGYQSNFRFAGALVLEVPAYTDVLSHFTATGLNIGTVAKARRLPTALGDRFPEAFRNRVLNADDLAQL